MSHRHRPGAAADRQSTTARRRRGFAPVHGLERLEDRRLLSAAFLDPAFGADGVVRTESLVPAPNEARALVATQSDGKIVVVGETASGSIKKKVVEAITVARYLPDGTLDGTFDLDGTKTLPTSTIAGAAGVAVDAAGRIVILGQGNLDSPSYPDLVLVRLNPDGTLDSTFGSEGRATVDFGASDIPAGVAIDSEGRIVVAGTTYSVSTGYDFAVARLTDGGALDASFSGDGRTTVDFSGANYFDGANAVAVDSANRVVVAGSAVIVEEGTPRSAFGAARLGTDGELDTTFGAGGRASVSFGAQTMSYVLAIAVDAMDRVVLGGSSYDDQATERAHDLAVARLGADGLLDAGGFGDEGRVLIDFGGTRSFDFANGAALDSQGRIVLAGETYVEGVYDSEFAVVRMDGTGAPDQGFGGDGVVTFGFGVDSYDYARGVAIDGDDRVLVVGLTDIPGSGTLSDFALARLDIAGALDPAFGGDGRVTTDIPGLVPVGDGRVLVQPDGKIVMAGITRSVTPKKGVTELWIVASRYHADGQPDLGFGSAGQVRIPFSGPGNLKGWSASLGLTLDPQGRIVLATESVAATEVSSITEMLVVRLLADGTPDGGFGTDGQVRVAFEDDYRTVVTAVAVDDSGRILVAGQNDGIAKDRDFAVARLDDAGNLDTSFGDNGRASLDLGSNDLPYSLAIDLNGRVVLAGVSVDESGLGQGLAVARLGVNGAPDATFDDDGWVVQRFGDGLRSDVAYDVAIDAAGRIVVAGSTDQVTGGGLDVAVVRLDADGVLDAGFGSGGLSTLAFGPAGAISVAYGVTIDPSGRIWLAGSTYDPTSGAGDFALARLLVDGAPDATFDGDGRATLNLGPGETFDEALDVALDPLGNLVVVGRTQAAGSPGDQLALIRLQGGVPPVIAVNPDTIAQDLQGIIALLDTLPEGSDPVITLDVETGDITAVLEAVAALQLEPGGEVIEVVLSLQSGNFGLGRNVDVPEGVRLVIEGKNRTVVIEGSSPALTVSSGAVVVRDGVSLVNATDAPTILVTGGSLTIRDSTIEESTGFDQAAIQVLGGAVDLGTEADPGNNVVNVNGAGSLVGNNSGQPILAIGTTFTIDGSPLALSSLSGTVFEDFNDDGEVNFEEKGIAGVTITITGTDFLGNAIEIVLTTDDDGAYIVPGLLPGSYRIQETQPDGYAQGTNSVGTLDDVTLGTIGALDRFDLHLAASVEALAYMNYNFGERPPAGTAVGQGQTAGIGFWNNRHGQALIKALNGGVGTQLGDWLAATFPNMFGANAGDNDLSGATNVEVAAFFQSRFVLKGVKLDAQVLATALAVYVTNEDLNPEHVGANHGFVIGGLGVGVSTFNVGTDGEAFGVANGTVMTVMDLLRAADAQAECGVLYDGNLTLRSKANRVFSAINQAGGN